MASTEMTCRLTKPLDEWEASDVLVLVEEQIEEGQRLEYKRQLELAQLPLIVRPEGVAMEPSETNREPGPWLGVLALPVDAPDPLLPMLVGCSATGFSSGDVARELATRPHFRGLFL